MSALSPRSKSAGASSARSNTENPEDSAGPQSQTLDDISDYNLELTAEAEEDSVALTMRYLGNAVAWITATDFIFSNRCIRLTQRLRLYLAITAPPLGPKAMADTLAIFTDVFNKSLENQKNLSKQHKSIVRSWSEEFAQKLPKSGEFRGKAHCEASLMGAIVQYNGQANTERSMQNTELPGIFHVSCQMSYTAYCQSPLFSKSTSNKPRAIGVATKCCWCCNMLATLLNSTGIRFSLPGSHGRIFPWALPSIGISYKVACSLENELRKQLSLAIQKRVDKLRNIPESQTSNSAASDQVVDVLESNWEELVNNLKL
jgi:hypothetical protein